MNIGIVDDKDTDLDIYSKLLKKYLDEKDIITCYIKPQKVMEDVDGLDVVFMDVQMPEQDGISLAKELLAKNKRLILVFLSDYDSYVWDSFSVGAIYYMRKRFFEKELKMVLEQINLKMQKQAEEYITLYEGKRVHHIKPSDIIYIEAQKKNIRIAMGDRNIIIRCPISKMEKELGEFNFLKVHRSYLVNSLYIQSLNEREIVMENNDRIPVSKYREQNVREEYMSYLKEMI